MELKTLEENGILDDCKYVEVIQIILLRIDTGKCWNYFTHIFFSNDIKNDEKRKYLTKGLRSINSDVQIIISKEVIDKQNIFNILKNAVKEQKWVWKEDEAELDEVFPVDAQFVPETDPTGSNTSDSTLVPLEYSLYGSNFRGGYYLCELFSKKENLLKILSEDDIKRIQGEIKKAKVGYNLEKLSDRVGNIICKIPINVIKHKPLKLSPKLGVTGQFTLSDKVNNSISCILQIVQENDHTIIENRVEGFILSKEFPKKEYVIEPNRYKNTIILSDKNSGIVYYSAKRDYSYGSSYYAIITPHQFAIQSSLKRTLILNGEKREIKLTKVAGLGNIYIEKEIYEMEKRQHKWMTEYEQKHYFFKSFVAGQEKEAVETVVAICNDKDLLWDLQEIWLIDPYLSADDILKTVALCEKFGISIKCLTNLRAINNNPATRIENKDGVSRTNATIMEFRTILNKAIPQGSDLKIEFRTSGGTTGSTFHDRYLILKYSINKPRAWSLGISVNSLGKSHHIIQIVQLPVEVIKTIDFIWNQANTEECLIYKN